jgi:predicted transcriptional regulator
VATHTIRLSSRLKRRIRALKLHPRETYEDVLERILEDLSELNARTRREVEQARREIERGEFRNPEEVSL